MGDYDVQQMERMMEQPMPEKRCSDCHEFKFQFGEYPWVCLECSGEFNLRRIRE